MSTERKQPEWLDNAVFYEIYPQSFRDTNADGIGDFNGIIEKLDYIKELGCTALWLNPCFLSPFGDAGYDVEDYYTVVTEPMRISFICLKKHTKDRCMSFLTSFRGTRRLPANGLRNP